MNSLPRSGSKPACRAKLMASAIAVVSLFSGFSQAVAQDTQRDAQAATDQQRMKVVLQLADQANGGGGDRSPLRFEMPRIPGDAAADILDKPQPKPVAGGMEVPAAWPDRAQSWTGSVPSMILMAGLTFLPAALLMTTSFVRIQITLGLLRQALGSPSIPGNQVIVALSLLLSVLVMKPVAEKVYVDAIVPCSTGRISQTEALRIASEPIKGFMLAQIRHTGHEEYLEELAEYARSQDQPGPESTGGEPESAANALPSGDDGYPLHVVAPAFLLSELTTALSIGFAVYLPFLVVDLVVATVLAAMGIWMMPPTLISTPAKLILFVLADGWMLTAGALINGFAAV